VKVILIVIDSFGIGELPDSNLFNDEGSNTYVNIVNKTGIILNNLIKLGLNNIDGINLESIDNPVAGYGKLKELTFAKDTTAGHYEISGIIMDKPYKIYTQFPKDLVANIEKHAGCKFIGNEKASGTEIIQRLGNTHRESGMPILYTSADSVMQIAADTEIIPLERLYEICEIARSLTMDNNSIGRIIARPFIKKGNIFTRTEDRKDYALSPPKETMLDLLKLNNYDVVSVGKIYDIFNGRGITQFYKTHNNNEGLKQIIALSKQNINGLVFANLVDTDMLYGHRNDAEGYANALKQIDNTIFEIIDNLNDDDILMITADHGCDPTTSSTDHSREYVPLLIYGKKYQPKNFGTIDGLNIISKSILNYFQLENHSNSLL
jgi:phosphopentomutase